MAQKEQAKGKSRRRHKKKKMPTAPLLCFDTEMTNHGELLEISICDIHGREIYHRYFRPKAKKWPSDIHHITPAMVADCKRFAAHRSEISRILSGARFVVGCAVSNDINCLRRHGVTLDGNKHTVFETQNWFWLLNDSTGRQTKNQAGLSTMADEYEIGFGDGGPHSATADTITTLEVFHRLVDRFNHLYPGEERVDVFDAELDDGTLCDELTRLSLRFNAAYAEAMRVYRMRNAGGYVSVVRREQGYSIKSHHDMPTDTEKYVVNVPVGDRKRAEMELRQHFESKTVKGYTGIFDLDEVDFDFVRKYTNEVDAASFLAAKRRGHRRHSRVDKARRAISSKKQR